ncbi:MAG: hypothetical protein ACO1N9_00240 [Flavobacterium sp.]
MKKFLLLIIVSLAISTGIFFINSTVIKSTWTDKLSEILFMAIPVFIVVALLFYANKAIFKTIKGLRKKKPSA